MDIVWHGEKEQYIPMQCYSAFSKKYATYIIVLVLLAVHCLMGCDTTNKISTNMSAFKAEQSVADFHFMKFGKQPLNENVQQKAQMCLVCRLNSELQTVDKLHDNQFHNKKTKKIQNLMPT